MIFFKLEDLYFNDNIYQNFHQYVNIIVKIFTISIGKI